VQLQAVFIKLLLSQDMDITQDINFRSSSENTGRRFSYVCTKFSEDAPAAVANLARLQRWLNLSAVREF
jgi:hypothetical protein